MIAAWSEVAVMGSRLILSLPNDLSGQRVPASILDENLSVIGRTTVGAMTTDIELDPGIYAARAVLPDGSSFEAAFEIPATAGVTDVMLKAAARPIATSGEASSRRFEPLTPDIKLNFESHIIQGDSSAPPNRSRLDSDAPAIGGEDYVVEEEIVSAPSLTLVTLDAFGNVRSEHPLDANSSDVVLIDKQNALRFVRVVQKGQSDLYIAVPTSTAESAELRFSTGAPASFEVKLEDDHADLLLRYLDAGRLEQLASLVSDYWPKAESLLELKHAKPIAATVGAYVILLVGPPNAEEPDYMLPGNWLDQWTDNLFKDFPWVVDGLCIRAELLARQGKHTEALSLLLDLPARGLPMFSGGLRFALDRLTGYRHAAIAGKLERRHVEAIDAVLASIRRTAAGADFRRSVLAFKPISKSAIEALQKPQERSQRLQS